MAYDAAIVIAILRGPQIAANIGFALNLEDVLDLGFVFVDKK
jgi:hypothetical protein